MPGTMTAEAQRGGPVRRVRPHRVVVGRRHEPVTPPSSGETFVALGDDRRMSKHWFSVEDVTVTPALDGVPSAAVRVRCESARHRVQVWDGESRVPLAPGASYLARSRSFFVGDYVSGVALGVRIELTDDELPPTALAVQAPSGERTVGLPDLRLTAYTRNVLVARYGGYYRVPPHFDPQPLAWAEVAIRLGELAPGHRGDERAERRAVRRPQDAVREVRDRVDQHHPGWLPPGSETEKSFHDRLRMVLEAYGVFERDALAGFDAAFSAGRPHRG